MHCRLVEWPVFDFLACCENEEALPHGSEDCRSDACGVIESGHYKPQSEQRWVSPLTRCLVVWGGRSEVGVPLARTSTPADTALAPPELAVGWQFHWRAVASPRAPSATA